MQHGRTKTMARLLITGTAAALAFAACSDQQTLLAPEDQPASAQGVGVDPINVIVVLKQGFAPASRAANRSRAAQVAEDLGIEARFTYGSVLYGFAGPVPAGRLNALRSHPLVEYVDLDEVVFIPPTVEHHRPGHGRGGDPEPDPDPDTQVTPWGIHRIGASEDGATGSGVSVYILDTGIDSRHPDLQANLGDGYAPRPCSDGCYETWDDDHGHGTHVAGTVGAIDNLIGVIGVAPQVTLHAVKVLGSGGSGWRSEIIAGFDWVAGHNPDRARVVNISIGGPGYKVGTCNANGYEGDPNAYHESICNARNAGVVIVASAGNSGRDAAEFAPASYYDAVITVSAVGCGSVNYWETEERCAAGTEGWTTWSNWGLGTDDAWPSRNTLPVLIAAPGQQVRSTVRGGDIGYMSGTSMAAPHVAGAVALLLERGSYTSDGSAFTGIRQALLDNAECTAAWTDGSGRPHAESFLNLRVGSAECALAPAPEPPTGLAATALSHHEIQLAWEYGDTGAASFQVSRLHDGYWVTSTLLGPELAYTDSALLADSTFTYRVRAVRDNVSSEWSNEATARTHAAPDGPEAPTDLVATARSDSEIYLTWAYDEPIPSDVQFQLSRQRPGDTGWALSPYLGQSLSYLNAGLPPETTFRYRVRAVRDHVGSEWSHVAEATTHPVPDVPDFDATFTYACDRDVCEFLADHRDGEAFYTWDYASEAPGDWAMTRVFVSPGDHVVTLKIRVGTAIATDSRTVRCQLRGKNLRCE
jgi:subtilisin